MYWRIDWKGEGLTLEGSGRLPGISEKTPFRREWSGQTPRRRVELDAAVPPPR